MGHRDDFRGFFEAEMDGLVRLAYRLTGDRAAAEDLAQEAMVKTFRAWRRIRERERPAVYARAALVNAHRSLLRRAVVAAKHRWHGEPPPATNDDAAVVWEELSKLPGRQRAAIVLHYYEDLTQNEIAQILGCPPGTVNSLVHRGLARLRERLANDDDMVRSDA